MSPDPAADQATEETSLLNNTANHDTPASDAPSERPLWSQLLHDAWRVLTATWNSSLTNYLLPCIPLGIVAESLGWSSATIFVFNFLAMLPLASLMSYSTEELSKSVGQTVGVLINTTFGNAVEMIVGITALSRGEISIVQSSMVGSILSGILLILGTCFLAGGYSIDLEFNSQITGMMASLMVIASASLIVPSALYAVSDSKSIEPDQNVLTLSRITAIILLILYIVFLYFQTKSHAHLFKEEEAGDKELDPWSASAVLVFATIGVTVCSDNLVDSVDGVVESLNISRPFIGLIIVPIVGNAGEYVTAVSASVRDKLDLAISLVVGSTLQIALFVTPFLVIVGWIINRPMTLMFDIFETAVLSLAVLVVNYLVQDGRTNYFAGALLIGTYTIIAVAFYVHPGNIGEV